VQIVSDKGDKSVRINCSHKICRSYKRGIIIIVILTRY